MSIGRIRIYSMIFRQLLSLLSILSARHLASAQFPANVDSVYTFIKYNSVHRLEVDWSPIDSTFAVHIRSAATLDDTMRCFVGVLRSLNDVHSQIYLNNQYYGHHPTFDDSTLAWLKPLNDRANSETDRITASMLQGNYAYLRVPGMNAWDQQTIDSLARRLYDTVRSLANQRPHGFVLDLRLNGGGNVYPMLSGLSPLLGNGTIVYEMTPDDTVARSWELQNGNFVIGGYRATNLTVDSTLDLASLPLAVLIGPVTKSSGTATAIAFKGRPKTVFIGEPTADGYSTANGYFQFAPNLWMNFSTTFVADRNKAVYCRTVEPDVKVRRYDNFDGLVEDPNLKAALEWLSRR